MSPMAQRELCVRRRLSAFPETQTRTGDAAPGPRVGHWSCRSGRMIGPWTRKVKDEGRMGGGRMGGWADGRMGGWADGRMGGWADGQYLLYRETTNRAIESPSQPSGLVA